MMRAGQRPSLIRVGYERFDGYLDGGLAAWQAAALPTAAFESIDTDTLYRRWQQKPDMTIIDVRRDDEWRAGHIPGALHFHLGDLPRRIDEVPRDQPITLICQGGYRAEIAASMLVAAGRHVIAVCGGGMGNWIEQGLPSAAGVDNQVTHAHP